MIPVSLFGRDHQERDLSGIGIQTSPFNSIRIWLVTVKEATVPKERAPKEVLQALLVPCVVKCNYSGILFQQLSSCASALEQM